MPLLFTLKAMLQPDIVLIDSTVYTIMSTFQHVYFILSRYFLADLLL